MDIDEPNMIIYFKNIFQHMPSGKEIAWYKMQYIFKKDILKYYNVASVALCYVTLLKIDELLYKYYSLHNDICVSCAGTQCKTFNGDCINCILAGYTLSHDMINSDIEIIQKLLENDMSELLFLALYYAFRLPMNNNSDLKCDNKAHLLRKYNMRRTLLKKFLFGYIDKHPNYLFSDEILSIYDRLYKTSTCRCSKLCFNDTFLLGFVTYNTFEHVNLIDFQFEKTCECCLSCSKRYDFYGIVEKNGNQQKFYIEIDGKSHDRQTDVINDCIKDALAKSENIKMCRVDIRMYKLKTFTTADLLEKLAEIKLFVNSI